MRTDPGFAREPIRDCLLHFFVADAALEFLPLGLDPNAAVYRASDPAGRTWFVKVKSTFGPGPALSRALHESGIATVLAPLRDLYCHPWTICDGRILTVYPFIEGSTAVESGLDREQWIAFGRSLRAVHDFLIPEVLQAGIRIDNLEIPSLSKFERMLLDIDTLPVRTEPGHAFADYVERCRIQIDSLIRRTRELRDSVSSRDAELVLCHGDIHAANILVGTDGRIHLVDWDAPLLAPRERDLIFVIGSRVARDVLPHEERWFFEGYGPVEIDPDAIRLYRYERVIEDLVEFGQELLASDDLANPDTAFALRIIETFFAPNGIATTAEHVQV